MHDALTLVVHAELGDTEQLAVGIERLNLKPGHRISNTLITPLGRHVVIRDCEH